MNYHLKKSINYLQGTYMQNKYIHKWSKNQSKTIKIYILTLKKKNKKRKKDLNRKYLK